MKTKTPRNGRAPRPLTSATTLQQSGWRVEFTEGITWTRRRAVSLPMTLGEAAALIRLFQCEGGVRASLLPPGSEGAK